MKKILCIVLAMVLLILPGCGNETSQLTNSASNEEVRYKWYLRDGIEFGMSEEEASECLKDEDIKRIPNYLSITHYEELRKCSALEIYAFENDSLKNVLYQFKQDEATGEEADYFGLCLELKTMLTKEYGEPLVSQEEWVNEEAKKSKGINQAIKDEDYIYRYYWINDVMEITLSNENNNDVLLAYLQREAN